VGHKYFVDLGKVGLLEHAHTYVADGRDKGIPLLVIDRQSFLAFRNLIVVMVCSDSSEETASFVRTKADGIRNTCSRKRIDVQCRRSENGCEIINNDNPDPQAIL